jgi:hypothetical protein
MAEREGVKPERWDREWLRREQRRDQLRATPQQRLEWLEQAIEFATTAGALPRRRPTTSSD